MWLLSLFGCPTEIGLNGSIEPPSITLITPVDGGIFDPGEDVLVCASVDFSAEVDLLEATLTSDVDGTLATEGFGACLGGDLGIAVRLSDATHTLSLSVTDPQGRGDTATATITPGENVAPACEIVTPLTGATYGEGATVTLTARVDDPNGGQLEVTLDSSLDDIIGTQQVPANSNVDFVFSPSNGTHDLVLTATDERGEADLCVVQIEVEACQDGDGDGFENCDGDCDDNEISVYPGATEDADGRDNDCDGTTDEGTVLYDDDGDGFSEIDGDCDDADPGMSPNAADVPDDGIDQDCSGDDTVTCFLDHDSDGVGVDTDVLADDGDCFDPGEAPVSGDCDDDDASRYPGANDIPDDGIDQDCDGSDAQGAPTELYDGIDNDGNGICDEGFLAPGDLILTEVMVNPDNVNDWYGEWFEVYNTTSTPIHLCLWRFFDTDNPGDSFDVSDESLVIQPHSYFVFAASGDPTLNGGLPQVDYVYGANIIYLSNSSPDGLGIQFAISGALSFEVDRVEQSGWMNSPGHSFELGAASHTYTANDVQANWCESFTAYGSDGNHGTPGAPPSCTP